MPGLGDEFRAAREARHLSLSDVSEQIHIRSVYLQSIEDEDWSAIAAPVYVRGFIRTYARFLALDPERAVDRFNAALGESAKQPEQIAVTRVARRGVSPWLWIAAVVAGVLVGFVGYNYYEFQQAQKPDAIVGFATAAPAIPPAGSATSPAAVPPGPGAASPAPVLPSPAASSDPASRGLVEVRLTRPSWLLVTIDGTKTLEGLFPAGTRKGFSGRKVSIRAGNAGGVDLTVDGKDLGPMGPSGAVVDRTIPSAE